MNSKWLCCSPVEPTKRDHGLPKSSRGRGYSSFAITQDLAASDASMYGAQGIGPGQASPGAGSQTNQGSTPFNPYRRSRDTTWAPDIATGALFPPSNHSNQTHPSLNSQQLHSGASTQSPLHTGESTALRSGRTTAKQDKLNSKSSKLRSASGLQSGDSKTHPELTSAVLRSAQGGGHSQAQQPTALHSGHSSVYPMLHTNQPMTPALHSGHSVGRPDLNSRAPPNLPTAALDQHENSRALYTGNSGKHPLAEQHQLPWSNTQQQQQPVPYLYTGDSNAQPMLSSSTPDRMETPYAGRQSSPSCDSQQDGAERGFARGPAPTGPPSTVSRNGRIVERAAKGIYLTLERQADGKNKLLRIRFNRNVYTKKEAEVWWNKSKHGLARAHNLAPGGPVPDEQPGRVFVGEGRVATPPPRPGSINLEYHMSSVITDVTDGRNEAPVEVVKQADLLRKGLQYSQSAIYGQHNCQQLMLCACHAVHALLMTSNQSQHKDKVSRKFMELLSEAVETVAVFSEPGWLLRLEGHVDDVTQMTKLNAELAQLAGFATGSAGFENLAGPAGVTGVQASSSFKSEYSLPDSTAGPAGIAGVQSEEVGRPDWRDDSDALRGRLLELGGVAGLQTDTDCLLLKDLCRPGLEDVTFLELIDLELQEHQANEVRGAHEVIRHTSMRLFWVRAAGPHEEVPWARFWKSFPATLHGADTNHLMRQTVTVIDNRRLFQGAVSGMASDHTTAVDIDKAFPPGFSIPDSFQRLLEIARQQKMRVNSGMPQRDLLDSGIDILDTNADVYAEGKPFASQHNVDAQLYAAGFWRCEQDALLASFRDSICRLEDRLSQASRNIYSTQQVSLSDGGQGRSGVALLESKGTDTGLLAFGLARQMLQSGRWSQVAYVEMAGTGNEEEASARIAAALGLPSYPTSIDETLRICTWLKSRPASAGFLGLVVDSCNGFKWPEDADSIIKLLSTILADTTNVQIVVRLPEACTLSRTQWIVDSAPRMSRAVGRALLQGNLGHIQAPALQLESVVQGCQQRPCLVHIAGRGFAQGCLGPQDVLNNSSGFNKQESSSHFLLSMQDNRRDEAEEAGGLPKWLLQMLSQDEREGLLRLSVFPLAITMDMATCVLPSTYEQSQVQSIIHQLHRLGFLKGNPAHNTYKVEPYLRPHLAALAQQQPSALYSPSLLAWSQACLQTCATATALYSAHAQVSALRMIDRERGQIDCLLNTLAQDLPAKTLPVVAEIITNHMDVLNYRLSGAQRQQLCTNIGRAAEETGDLLAEVQCAVQLAEQGCMDRPHAVQGLAGSMRLVERALGPDHPLVAHILLHRARLLRQQHQYHQANEALKSCLSIQEAALGLDQPEVADTLQEMAITLQAQGLKQQAEPVLRQCLAIRSHALGMQHPDTAAVLHALAVCLLSVDRLTDAEGMLGQAWRTMKQCLGHVHPKLAQVLADLATLKARQDESTEAQQLLRRSAAMWRHMGAGSNPALLSALRMLIKLGSNSGASGQEEDQRLRQECSCIDQLVNPWSPGLEMHLQACARLSSLQVIASLPRGAARRLYTAPHSLLDTFPTQPSRQLTDTAADDSAPGAPASVSASPRGRTYPQQPQAQQFFRGREDVDHNVLLQKARVSPVSSAASSQSAESVKAADIDHTAGNAAQDGAKTGCLAPAALSASAGPEWLAANNSSSGMEHAYSHDPVSGQFDSPIQYPAFAAPSPRASSSKFPPPEAKQHLNPPAEPESSFLPWQSDSAENQSQAAPRLPDPTALPLQHSPQQAQQTFSTQLGAERVRSQPAQSPISRGHAHSSPSDPAQSFDRSQPSDNSQAFHDPQFKPTGSQQQDAWPMPEHSRTPDHSARSLSSTPILAPNSAHAHISDHSAGALSSTPIFAPEPDRELHQQVPQAAPAAAKMDSANSTHRVPVLSSLPLLPNNESTRQTLPVAGAYSKQDSRPSLATAGQQHSFSVAPAEDADQIPEGQLSARQRALRSLSSKGIQMSRTASAKGSGELHNLQAGGSGNYEKSSLGLWQGQRQDTDSNDHGVTDGKTDQGVNSASTAEPLPRGAGAVRALASRLDSRNHSRKHMH